MITFSLIISYLLIALVIYISLFSKACTEFKEQYEYTEIYEYISHEFKYNINAVSLFWIIVIPYYLSKLLLKTIEDKLIEYYEVY